jgi:hypothetical protein
MRIEGSSFKANDDATFGIRCPQCPAIMRNINVKAATSKAVHEVFEQQEQKYLRSKDPDWRWCLVVGCDIGQLHGADSGNVCTCHKCVMRACIAYEKPYHDGEVCEAYRLRTRNQLDEEQEAMGVIKRTTKDCPHCGVAAEKDGGCPNVDCESIARDEKNPRHKYANRSRQMRDVVLLGLLSAG